MKTFEKVKEDIIKYNLKEIPNINLRVAMQYANGCGAKGSWFKPPKTMWGRNVETACIRHDIRWEFAKCYQDLLDANEEFWNDIIAIIGYATNAIMFSLRKARAFTYYKLVGLFGTKSYAIKRGFKIGK